MCTCIDSGGGGVVVSSSSILSCFSLSLTFLSSSLPDLPRPALPFAGLEELTPPLECLSAES